MGRPRTQKLVFLQLGRWSQSPLGLPWTFLGASCWLIFRSLSLPWPLLANFWPLLAFLSLSEPIFTDFSSPGTLPEPRKSTEKQWFSWVFGYFHILLMMAENLPKMLPKCSQDASKGPQDPSQTLPICPKMPQDGPKMASFGPQVGSFFILLAFPGLS